VTRVDDDPLWREAINLTSGITQSTIIGTRSVEHVEESLKAVDDSIMSESPVEHAVQYETAPEPSIAESGALAAPVAPNKVKCQKCDKRSAKEGCTQLACIQCCDDGLGCESHKKQRSLAIWKEQVLSGTTDVQIEAARIRKMKIQSGNGKQRCFFREPGFVYQGDTVVIWDIRAYASNPKWRDDAIRKSTRRKRAELATKIGVHENGTTFPNRRLRNSRKRFSRIMNDLYEKNGPK
jgi:hypothetical protein